MVLGHPKTGKTTLLQNIACSWKEVERPNNNGVGPIKTRTFAFNEAPTTSSRSARRKSAKKKSQIYVNAWEWTSVVSEENYFAMFPLLLSPHCIFIVAFNLTDKDPAKTVLFWISNIVVILFFVG